MGYNLTIDQGNSSAKIALHDGEDIIEVRRIDNFGIESLEEIVRQYRVDAAIYCSVSVDGEDVVGMLREWGVRTICLSAETTMPIVIDYHTPATLGRDRIAVAAGAAMLYPGRNVLVVDAGTAITYDVVTPQRHYLGGNIAPGISMRLNALHAYTSRLPKVNIEGDTPLWGYDTATAMRSGALRGIVAEIAYYRSRLEAPMVVLTGGNAMEIAPLLDFEVEVDKNLVNKGLNSILLYNERT